MITVEHLTKCYGDFKAVDDLSFEIDEGHVYGFLGPNGAGKSTTMNIMTGCLSATAGHVRIDGYDIFEEPDKAKRLIGYLPEHPPLYLNESPAEYLRFVGEAKGLRGEELRRQIGEVIQKTGIESVKNRRISALSKGYRQRVGIAQALLGNPKVIILDEPTVGLDPIQIIEIRDLIRELGKSHTVIFSSHILSEVQTICDQILMIARGRLVVFDRPENLEKRLLAPSEIRLVAEASPEETERLLAKVGSIAETELEEKDGNYTAACLRTDCKNIYEVSGAVFRAFAEGGRTLVEMALKRANLEDVFIELTENGTEEKAAEEGAKERPLGEEAGSSEERTQEGTLDGSPKRPARGPERGAKAAPGEETQKKAAAGPDKEAGGAAPGVPGQTGESEVTKQ